MSQRLLREDSAEPVQQLDELLVFELRFGVAVLLVEEDRRAEHLRGMSSDLVFLARLDLEGHDAQQVLEF